MFAGKWMHFKSALIAESIEMWMRFHNALAKMFNVELAFDVTLLHSASLTHLAGISWRLFFCPKMKTRNQKQQIEEKKTNKSENNRHYEYDLHTIFKGVHSSKSLLRRVYFNGNWMWNVVWNSNGSNGLNLNWAEEKKTMIKTGSQHLIWFYHI